MTVGAPCPDHLVHTKRLPLWIPYDPETDDAEALCERIAEAAEAYRARLPRVRRSATPTRRSPRPIPTRG